MSANTKATITAVLLVVGIIAAALLGRQWGLREQKMVTVVRLGSPYYTGVYYGKCAWAADGVQACATDTDAYGEAIANPQISGNKWETRANEIQIDGNVFSKPGTVRIELKP